MTWNGRSALRRRGSSATGPDEARGEEERERQRRDERADDVDPVARARTSTYARHASIDATLSAKWIPSTGHTCKTSDETTMCAACSGTPTATSRGAHGAARPARPSR